MCEFRLRACVVRKKGTHLPYLIKRVYLSIERFLDFHRQQVERLVDVDVRFTTRLKEIYVEGWRQLQRNVRVNRTPCRRFLSLKNGADSPIWWMERTHLSASFFFHLSFFVQITFVAYQYLSDVWRCHLRKLFYLFIIFFCLFVSFRKPTKNWHPAFAHLCRLIERQGNNLQSHLLCQCSTASRKGDGMFLRLLCRTSGWSPKNKGICDVRLRNSVRLILAKGKG